jgi:hypothetical protein
MYLFYPPCPRNLKPFVNLTPSARASRQIWSIVLGNGGVGIERLRLFRERTLSPEKVMKQSEIGKGFSPNTYMEVGGSACIYAHPGG